MAFNCRMVELVCDVDKITLDKIREVLARSCVEKWLYVIHDKDDTRPHYHVYLKFVSSQNSSYIAKWYGVEENFLQKIKGQFSDAVKYSIHANRLDKYQYDKSIIKSNFDIEPYLKVEKEDSSEYDVVIQKILDGEIRKYNQGLIPNQMYLSKEWQNKIKLAFDKREHNIKNKRLEREDMFQVLYIQGDTGKGKSVFARELCKSQNMSYYVSSSSNDPLDGYEGQDVLILDDIRYDTFKPNDLYKLLDTTNVTSVKSRYRNKSMYECKMIIITCIHSWKTWYEQMADEPKKQFERRISQVIEVDDTRFRLAENQDHKIQEFGEWQFNPFSPTLLYGKKGSEKTNIVKSILTDAISKLTDEDIEMLSSMTKTAIEDGFINVSNCKQEELPFK